jgi:hypothetical protein
VIGVPVAAGIAGLLRLLAHFADQRIALGMAGERGRIDFDLTETLGEGHLMIGANVLIAEKDHAMFIECGADIAIGAVVERLGEIDAADDGADIGGNALHVDCAVLHGTVPYGRICRTAPTRRTALRYTRIRPAIKPRRIVHQNALPEHRFRRHGREKIEQIPVVGHRHIERGVRPVAAPQHAVRPCLD